MLKVKNVGVGTPLTRRPLHRSVRALLMHTALTLGNNAHSLKRIGMMEFNLRKPQIDNWFHFLPSQLVPVSSATQSAPPHVGYGEAEDNHGLLVAGDSIVT